MKLLQGEVDFLTGGYSPRALCMIWCNSNTDSKVWTKEVNVIINI